MQNRFSEGSKLTRAPGYMLHLLTHRKVYDASYSLLLISMLVQIPVADICTSFNISCIKASTDIFVYSSHTFTNGTNTHMDAAIPLLITL